MYYHLTKMIREEVQSDSGVSPVIGVLLMVSLTVILAAIIGTYVLDLAGTLQDPPQAAVSFNNQGHDSFQGYASVEVVLTNAPRVDMVILAGDVDGVVDGNTCDTSSDNWPSDDSNRPTIENVGDSVEVCLEADNREDANGTIRAIGSFDGYEQVLQTHSFDFS